MFKFKFYSNYLTHELLNCLTQNRYRIFSIRRPGRLFKTWPQGPGVYLKPAFNRGLAFINEVKFSSFLGWWIISHSLSVKAGRFLPWTRPDMSLYLTHTVLHGLSGKWGVRSAECGVWKMGSVEHAECGKRAVWKMRSVENKSLQNGKLNNDISPLFFDISSLIRHIHWSNTYSELVWTMMLFYLDV